MDTRTGKNDSVPFGLLFEELAPDVQHHVLPIYDEEEGLSYAKDLQGHLVPYVEIAQATGTETITRVRDESTDAD